jgi:hypothetical protein
MADTAAGSTISPGKDFWCASSFASTGSAEDCAAICTAYLPVERGAGADHTCVGWVREFSLGGAVGHLGQRSDTAALVAPQGDCLFCSSAHGTGHRRVGHGAGEVAAARFSVAWDVARSSICCRTAAPGASCNGYRLIQEPRSSAGIGPVCMPRRRRKPRRTRFRWLIYGAFFKT